MTLVVAVNCLGISCCSPLAKKEPTPLVEVASSDRQWTGVAVSRQGRVFVNYPRWSDQIAFSVGELQPNGSVMPFPDRAWNAWKPSMPPSDRFICVQSVFVDRDDYLWVLDSANPQFMGVVKGGPKLVKVDLGTNRVVRVIQFNQTVAPSYSYLNDVRVDTDRGVAYISDSGTGALIVLDLSTGTAWRALAAHPSTKSEDVILVIEGSQWRLPDGRVPRVHVDGIALDKTGDYLYFQALTGRTLYRLPTKGLREGILNDQQLASEVEAVAATGAADGIEFGPDGMLYLTSLEDNAVKRLDAKRHLEIVAQDPRLKWPDSLAFGPDGFLYVTTSQIHVSPQGTEPYRIFKIRVF